MVKAFRFRLERLLDLRRRREEEAQRRLAEAMRSVQERNRKLLGLMAERDGGKAALRAMRMDELDLGRMRLQEDWLGSLERQIRDEFDLLQEEVRAEVGKRRALTEAVRGVKVLERLRERRRREWARGLDGEERKFLDEVAAKTERAV